MNECRFGFSKGERLHKRKEFLEVYERGDKIQTPHLVLYISENNLPRPRLGVTVSRKIGKPVVRNRVKRRLREIFRTHKEHLSPPCDLVVNAKRSAAAASFQELRSDFINALERWKREKVRR